MVGDAVKVIALPAQLGILPSGAAMDTAGTTTPFTVMVMEFELAVVGLAHDALEVMVQLTTCPLVNEDVVYVALFVPTFDPFTFH